MFVMGVLCMSKMFVFINYCVCVIFVDGCVFVGMFIVFDWYVNVVLSDCEEYWKLLLKKGVDEDE